MTAEEALVSDPLGESTLETMALAHRYNAWQVDRLAPFLGRRVCEIGAGIGNISRRLAEREPELLVLTDQRPEYLDRLRSGFASRPRVMIEPLSLPDPDATRRFREWALDTVVALNVLEHIPNDRGALESMAGLLAPGGRVVLLVPAMPALYGSLDRELGHARRYDRAGLGRLLSQAGLKVEHLSYFNLVGVLGWWTNARLRRVPQIPQGQLAWFDRLVPLLRAEDHVRLPFGQSLIAVGSR